MIELNLPSQPKQLFRALFVDPVWQKKTALIIVALSLILLSLAQTAFILLIGPLFQVMFAENATSSFTLAEILPANVTNLLPGTPGLAIAKDWLIWGIPIALFLTSLCKGIASYFFQVNQQRIALWVAKTYRDRLFGRLLESPYLTILKKSPGDWMATLMNDVLFLQTRYSDFAAILLKDAVLVLAALLAVLFIHWQMALVLLILAPVMVLILGRLGGRISEYAENWQRDLREMSSRVLDLRQRFHFIAAQGGQALELDLYRTLNQSYLREIKKSLWLRSSFAPVLELVGFVGFALVIYLINEQKFGFDRSFGPETLIQFFAAIGVLLKPLKSIGEQFSKLAETRGALVEGYSLFRSIAAAAAPAEVPAKQSCSDLKECVIHRVAVSYTGDPEQAAFRSTALDLRGIDAVAIVGPSGAGKSTLIKCLAGLIPPLIWDASLSYRTLQGRTAFVSQKPYFFQDSLLANLFYGTEAAAGDSDELWELLAIFELDTLVKGFPQGLAEPIQGLQSNLSGGQLQRLTIIRALLRGREHLVLDEATSAIEDRLEKKLSSWLIARAKARGQRLFAITHRLDQLALFDQVWFVENGTIVEKGGHLELLNSRRYRQFIGDPTSRTKSL